LKETLENRKILLVSEAEKTNTSKWPAAALHENQISVIFDQIAGRQKKRSEQQFRINRSGNKCDSENFNQ